MAPAVRLPPAPTATAPARIHSSTLSTDTPPVGMISAWGMGPWMALMTLGPNSSPGNTLMMSAPASMPETTSVMLMAPGMQATR